MTATASLLGPRLIFTVCSKIITLPKVPSAEVIRLNDQGFVEGLF
jgi:formate--tetrahydrofolate ligase